ncbi:ArnT family glycosyltransferase [Hamadaea tsunoensis]|uniref:ArnT family glycosyltransferase n=1 Tax=Hamadaea tsunoensis TaxID=53368 RepID=UPI00040B7A02|nr:glycosyltransferase family 39 protein [Hamadaea tsunoensis]
MTQPTGDRAPRPFAYRPVGLIATVAAVVMFVFSSRYGFHRDELYYIVAGGHPAFGYDDQPPLVPLWAGLSHLIAGSWPDVLQLMLLRLPSDLAVAGVVLLGGAFAALMGGERRAQIIAAVTMAIAPVVMISGHLLSTTIFDILAWSGFAYVVVWWVVTRIDRHLLWLGPIAGVALQVKTLLLVYALALVLGLLICGPRGVLIRWQLWVSAGVAAVIWAPNVWWQAAHGWPQVEMTAVIRSDGDFGGRVGILPSQFLMIGPVAALVLIAGLWRVLRVRDARPFRFLGWAYILVVVIVIATGGREYYPSGAFTALVGAGGIAVDGWISRGAEAVRLSTVRTIAVISAAMTAILGLPVYPVAWLHATPEAAVNYDAGETATWPSFTAQVAAVYQGLGPGVADTAVIIAGNYGEAGALEHYGAKYHLPPVYSGHLAFWRWGPPPDSRTGPVIIVSESDLAADLATSCGSWTLAGRIDNGVDLDNDEQGARIYVCRDPRRSWSQAWPGLYRM